MFFWALLKVNMNTLLAVDLILTAIGGRLNFNRSRNKNGHMSHVIVYYHVI